MVRTWDRGILVGVGLVTVMLVVNAALTYRSTRQLNEDAGAVARTHEVLDLIDDVLLALVDAETGERGFLLTGQEEFLQPYQRALPRLRDRLGWLRAKTADNPSQTDRVKRLEGLTALRVALLGERIDLRRQHAKDPGALAAAEKGRGQMEAIRGLVAEMKEEEEGLLLARVRQSDAAYAAAVTTGLLTAASGLAAVAAFVLLVNRSLAARQRAAAEIKEQREWLRVTLDSIGDAVIVTDTEGRVVLINPVALSLTGWTREEAERQSLEKVFPVVNEQTRRPVESPVRRALREGTVVGPANHTVLVARGGAARPIDDSAAPIRGESGKVLGVVLIFRDVAERRRAEETRRQLAAIVESSGDAVVGKDLVGRITSWNGGAERLYGYAAEEVLGQPYSILVPTDRPGNLEDTSERLRRGSPTDHFETVRRKKDGGLIEVSVSHSPIRDGDGRVVGTSVIARDVTERNRSAAALREAEQRFRQVAENIREVFWMSDPHKNEVLYVSPAYEEIWGRSCGSLYERPMSFFEAIHPEDQARVRAASLERQGRGEPSDVEYRVVRPDGSVRRVRDRSFPVRDAAGTVYRVVGIAEDVTERKQSEDARRQSEERFSRFMEHLPGLAWIKDAGGRYVYANDAALRAFRTPAAQLYGRTDAEVLPPQTARQFRANDELALASAAGVRVIETLEHPDGAVRHSVVSKFPIRGPGGEVSLVGGIAVDVTDLKRVEEALKEADRHKDEFLAMLAHELRNPLAPVRNALHILKLPGADPAVAERARAMMERQVEHMVRLVDDLLDVSRIMRGKIELRREPVELTAVVARAVETAQPAVDAEGHELTVALPPEPLWLHGDLVRLAQVAGNLLHNAAKYTERGGKILIAGERGGDEAVLRVRDSGIGIAADVLPRIFDMFVQAERRTRDGRGGLGIGLTLVRRIVEMHGGSVVATSPGPGKGSEFVVRLPLAPLPGDTGLPAPDGPSARGAASRRVLVVDDNADAADTLALLLRLQGHDVRVAHDGPSALSQASAEPPDVALLDIGMPGMDGYELARRFRATAPLKGVLLVAVTGWGQEEDRRRTREAGFDYHLVKPVEARALEGVLAGRAGGGR
jgi:PAS domain S-box-containing protein